MSGLFCRFGGGPAIQSLVQCHVCEETIKHLKHRQVTERQTFLTKKSIPANNMYAISMNWFRKWEAFVHVS